MNDSDGRADVPAMLREMDRWLKRHDGEWCCCSCGPSKTSRADWCDRGCGRDYNAMIRIDHWRMGRLFKMVARTDLLADYAAAADRVRRLVSAREELLVAYRLRRAPKESALDTCNAEESAPRAYDAARAALAKALEGGEG